MALRESGRAIKQKFNLEALVRPALDSGVDGGAELLAFADALLGADRNALDRARQALADRLSPAAVAAASIIAANFSKNDRISNGLGIPLEKPALLVTAGLRKKLGLNEYRSAVNSLGPRHRR